MPKKTSAAKLPPENPLTDFWPGYAEENLLKPADSLLVYHGAQSMLDYLSAVLRDPNVTRRTQVLKALRAARRDTTIFWITTVRPALEAPDDAEPVRIKIKV